MSDYLPLADLLTLLSLDRDGDTPLFRQLHGRLKEAILDGRLGPGARLPATRALAQGLGVSRQTVLAAYDQLTAEGYLGGAVGSGTYVSASLPASGTRVPSDEPARLLRPLSARGVALASGMARVRHHDGPLRAFRPSMPALDLFPFDVWRRLEARHWRRSQRLLGYGDAAGHAPLRELLCAYLKASRGVRCTPEQVIVTSGSQQALYLLAQVLLAPGDDVWIESPGYQGAAAPFAVAGARVCPVPVDAEGMDVAYAAARYPAARLAFATPSHQLPLGVTMSLRRRLDLLRWAAARRACLRGDAVEGAVSRPAPGLRGGAARAGRAAGAGEERGRPAQSAAAAGGARRLHRRGPFRPPHPALARRLWRAQGSLARRVAGTPGQRAGLRAVGRRAGYLHALPAGPRRREVARHAYRAGIDLRTLGYYTLPGAGADCAVAPGLLLGFAAFAPEAIREGVAGLARVLEQPKKAPVHR